MALRRFYLLACLLAAAPVTAAVTTTGTIVDPRLAEVSGLAASRAHPGLLWVENDSGNPADIFLIEPDGKARMTLHIDGVPNIDWEDLASFDLDDHHYLLLADTGDNFGWRPRVHLYVIEEPAAIGDAHAHPAWRIDFDWPGGARDCEAVAVDVATDSILLISKRTVPARLYRLPLRPPTDRVQTAQRLGDLAGIPQPTSTERKTIPRVGKVFAQVTAADVAPDRKALAVLTYRGVYLYHRGPQQDWAAAVAGTPQLLSFGSLAQAEAMAFGLDGRWLYVTGERLPAPIRRIDVPR